MTIVITLCLKDLMSQVLKIVNIMYYFVIHVNFVFHKSPALFSSDNSSDSESIRSNDLMEDGDVISSGTLRITEVILFFKYCKYFASRIHSILISLKIVLGYTCVSPFHIQSGERTLPEYSKYQECYKQLM